MIDDKPEVAGSSSGADMVGAARKPRTPPTIDLAASRLDRSDADTLSSSPDPAPASADARKTSKAAKAGLATLLGSGAIPAMALASAAILIAGLAWWEASQTPDVPNAAMLEALGARLARLEGVSKPAVTEPDTALATRLEALEKSTEASLAAVRDELAAVRVKAERAASTVEEIKAAPQSTSPGGAVLPDVSGLDRRIAELDAKIQALVTENTELKATQADVSANRPQSSNDNELKRAVAAIALDLAVRQGGPFPSALTVAKKITDDSTELKPLEQFASDGVPGVVALSRGLIALLPQLGAATGRMSQSSGWFDRLRSSASRLVKIRRTDAIAADDVTAAIAARANAAARRNDVADAMRELKALPQPDRVKVQPWIDLVVARDAALAASRQFATRATTALTKSAP